MSQERAIPFEEAYRELEGTVNRLEAGDLALEESLALFERGTALARRCQQALDEAELKVQELAAGNNRP